MADALRKGEQILVLLPEIALTSEFFDRLKKSLGKSANGIGVTLLERDGFGKWLQVDAKLVIGAAQLYFCPFEFGFS